MFNEKLFSKGFFKVGDLKGLYHSLSSKWKKNMTSNESEVLLKTVPFNGVVYSNAELLCSKRDLQSPYFRNIKTTYSEKEV